MKVIIEKKDFRNEFSYYQDQLASKEEEILDVRFWHEGIELDVDEIEIVIGKPKKEEAKETVISIEDYEMLAGENKCFATWLENHTGLSKEQISAIAYGELK